MRGPRVAVLGLDGMSWKLIAEAAEKGITPNISKMCDEALRFVMESTIPPLTPPAWTSMMTGVNPGKHGIFDFVLLDTKSRKHRLFTVLDLMRPRIHEMLAMVGLKTICVNPEPPYPLPRIKGCGVLSVRHSPRPSCTEGFERYLREYPPHDEIGHPESFLDRYRENAPIRHDLIREMARKEDWNLFWVILPEPDTIYHRLGDDIFRDRRAAEIFRSVDLLAKELMELSDFVFLVSDHGLRTYDKVICLNTAFWRAGLVNATSSQEKGVPEVDELAGLARREVINAPSLVLKVLSSNKLRPLRRIANKLFFKVTGRRLTYLRYADLSSSKAVQSTRYGGVHVFHPDVMDDVIRLLSSIEGIKEVKRRDQVYAGLTPIELLI